MNFILAADTDIGTTKTTNQDSMSLKLINTGKERMVMAVLCDGMGGLDKGEVASASVIKAFDHWTRQKLPLLCNGTMEEALIKAEWETIVADQNRILHQYGASQGVTLGTTLVALLITEQHYYLMNVGDSRAYEITDSTKQLTEDQTFVAREIRLGNMTPEQARMDPRRNVLLQCIGASDMVFPDMLCGTTSPNSVYMLCTDGFRHEITSEEIYDSLKPEVLMDEAIMNQKMRELIELNKSRQEKDNITVALVKTL